MALITIIHVLNKKRIYENIFSFIFICLVGWDCRICQLYDCWRLRFPPHQFPNGATCWLFAVMLKDETLMIKGFKSPPPPTTTLALTCVWWAVGEAWCDQLASNIKFCSDFCKNLNQKVVAIGSILLGEWLFWKWKPNDTKHLYVSAIWVYCVSGFFPWHFLF